MSAIIAMPAKKAIVAINPADEPKSAAKSSTAPGIKSRKEIYTITPAEKPSAVERNFVFCALAKNDIRLPSPVERPATSVSPRANIMEDKLNSILKSIKFLTKLVNIPLKHYVFEKF